MDLLDVGESALINIGMVLAFLVGYAFLRTQPVLDRVYFTKWYVIGARTGPTAASASASSASASEQKEKVFNTDLRSYVKFVNLEFLSWIVEALRMSEADLVQHAGLDSAVFLRIYTLGLKIFIPVTITALLIIVPLNAYGGMLVKFRKEIVYSNIDKFSISNVRAGSQWFWIHILMAYAFTMWTCFILYHAYGSVASTRLKFLASQHRRADQFTVLVRNIQLISGDSVAESVEQFFQKNHPDHYLGHQLVYNTNKYANLVRRKERLQNSLDYCFIKLQRHPKKRLTIKKGFLGLCGEKMDSIEYYRQRIMKIDEDLEAERQRVLKDPNAIVPVAFVTFDSRWGAAVCAQTKQSKNPTQWLTDWAPEPRDVYWSNLAIPFVSLSIRKLLISAAVFALVFCYMIPIAAVQSLANIENLEKNLPFLKPVIEQKVIKSFLQGFLPGLSLKIFMYTLPSILMFMSKVEGHYSLSALERRAASKYYYFMIVNVFLGSIISGTAFEQLNSFLHQPPTEIPKIIGLSIPMKATFFMTYIMVDGWSGIAGEIVRPRPVIMYLLRNIFIKTERQREKAMKPQGIGYSEMLPTLQLYFLLGLVYSVVSPVLLPFILIFFAIAYVVYRHQVINVYHQQYESAGAFWPHVHTRIIASLLISQLLLLGLLSTKKAANSTPLLAPLPILTYSFHRYCKSRFEPAFRKYPLEEAMEKDSAEEASEPSLDLKAYLADAYLNPIFHISDTGDAVEIKVDKGQSAKSSSSSSESSSSPSSPRQHVPDRAANLVSSVQSEPDV